MLYRTLTASAVLIAMAGCATRDTQVPGAWLIEPVFNVRHTFQNSQAYYALGRYHDGSKAWIKAVEAYRKAIAADAQNIEAYNALGVALAQMGRYADAETTLRQAVALAPGLAHVRSNLGYVLLLAGKPDEAVPELRAAVRQDTGDAIAATNLRDALGRIAVGQITQATSARTSTATAAPVALASPVTALALAPLSAAEDGTANAPASVSSVPAANVAALRIFDQPNVPSLQGTTATATAIASTAAASPAPVALAPVTRPVSAADGRTAVPVGTNLRSFEQAADATGVLARPAATTPAQAPAVIGRPIGEAPAAVAPPAAAALPGPDAAAATAPVPRLEISNGNGVTGMAASVGRWLAAQGLSNARLTNQLPYTQQQTVVQYRNGHEHAAQSLVQMLPRAARLEITRELRGDLRVIIGRDWQPIATCLQQSACPAAVSFAAVAVVR